MTIKEAHIDLIIKAMDRCKGHIANASEKLEISERTLYRYIKKYNICKVDNKYIKN